MGFPLKKSSGSIGQYKAQTHTKRVKGAYRQLAKTTARRVRKQMKGSC